MNWPGKVLSLLAIALYGCTGSGSEPAGSGITGTKTGSETTSGIVATLSGQPVSGARVSIYSDTFASAKSDALPVRAATTDANGFYKFDTIPVGKYFVAVNDFESQSARSNVYTRLTNSIEIKDTLDTLVLDTACAVFGRIVLYNNDDPRTVDIFVRGSSFFAQPDIGGNFNFGHMPKGVYELRVRSTLDLYSIIDTVISISRDTFLKEIRLPYKGGLALDTVTANYNVMKQSVYLSWPRVDTAVISGYNVYRAATGENDSLLTKKLVLSNEPWYEDTSVIEGLTYSYHVVSKNKISGIESSKTAATTSTIKAIGIDSLVNSIRVGGVSDSICDFALLDSNTYGIAQKWPKPRIYRYTQTGDLLSSFWPADSFHSVSNNSIARGDSQSIYFCASLNNVDYSLVKTSSSGSVIKTWSLHKQPYYIGTSPLPVEPFVRYTKGKVLLVWFEQLFTWVNPDTKSVSSFPKPYQTSMRCTISPDSGMLYFASSTSDMVISVDSLGRQTNSWHGMPNGIVAFNSKGTILVGSRTSNEVRIYSSRGDFRGRFRLGASIATMRAMEIDNAGLIHVLVYEKNTNQALVQCFTLKAQ